MTRVPETGGKTGNRCDMVLTRNFYVQTNKVGMNFGKSPEVTTTKSTSGLRNNSVLPGHAKPVRIKLLKEIIMRSVYLETRNPLYSIY